MGHPRPSKSWKLKSRQPRQGKAKPRAEVSASELVEEKKIAADTGASNLSKSDTLFARVWGSDIPAVLREQPLNLRVAVEETDNAAACTSLGTNLAAGNLKKNVTSLVTELLPALLSLTLRWFGVELGGVFRPGGVRDEFSLSAALFNECWLQLIEGLAQQASSDGGDERVKYHLSKNVAQIGGVYLNVVLMVTSIETSACASALVFGTRILEALEVLSLATERLIPITEPLMTVLRAAIENLPVRAEKVSLAIPRADVYAHVLKADLMQMADDCYHLYVAVRATDCLVKFVHLLHMHPCFCELAPVLQAQLRCLLKRAETKSASSKLEERLKQLIAAVQTAATQIETLRQNMISTDTPCRLSVFDIKTRRAWGLEALRAKLFL